MGVRYRLLTLSASLASILLVGCGGSGQRTTSPPPAVSITLAPRLSTILLGNSRQFSATVSGTANNGVSWTVDGIAGGNTTVGKISSTGLYTATPVLQNPATVTVSAVSQADPSKSATATVTVTSDIAVLLATVPNTGITTTGSTASLTATIVSSGKPNQGVVWAVNGIANGNSSLGTITVTGTDSATYTAPGAPPAPNTVTITATSAADPSKSASTVEAIDNEFLYASNAASNDVSAYKVGATGTLTSISGAPFAAGTRPLSIAADPLGQVCVCGR